MKVIVNSLLLIVSILFVSATHANNANEWIQQNCKSLDVIKPDSNASIVRDAMKSCSEVLKQWSEIQALQAQIRKSEQEMKGGAPGGSSGSSQPQSTADAGQSKAKVYSDSNEAFLLSVGGFADRMTAKIFYKGAIHTLGKGDSIGSAQVSSIAGDHAVLEQGGKRVVITPKTLDEIDAVLGLYSSEKTSKPQQGVAILTPSGIRGQLFTGKKQ